MGILKIVEEHSELTPAEARHSERFSQTGHGVRGTQAFFQAISHSEQELVADQMAHAVVDHFEAVKIQKQNREQGVLTPLCVFDEPPKPVYEKQPVGQPSQRIGYLSLGDVGLRACHSQGFSRIVEYRE